VYTVQEEHTVSQDSTPTVPKQLTTMIFNHLKQTHTQNAINRWQHYILCN